MTNVHFILVDVGFDKQSLYNIVSTIVIISTVYFINIFTNNLYVVSAKDTSRHGNKTSNGNDDANKASDATGANNTSDAGLYDEQLSLVTKHSIPYYIWAIGVGIFVFFVLLFLFNDLSIVQRVGMFLVTFMLIFGPLLAIYLMIIQEGNIENPIIKGVLSYIGVFLVLFTIPMATGLWAAFFPTIKFNMTVSKGTVQALVQKSIQFNFNYHQYINYAFWIIQIMAFLSEIIVAAINQKTNYAVLNDANELVPDLPEGLENNLLKNKSVLIPFCKVFRRREVVNILAPIWLFVCVMLLFAFAASEYDLANSTMYTKFCSGGFWLCHILILEYIIPPVKTETMPKPIIRELFLFFEFLYLLFGHGFITTRDQNALSPLFINYYRLWSIVLIVTRIIISLGDQYGNWKSVRTTLRTVIIIMTYIQFGLFSFFSSFFKANSSPLVVFEPV